MSNQTHDPQEPGPQTAGPNPPGHGTGAPEPQSNATGPTAKRDAAAAEYSQQAGEHAEGPDPAEAQIAALKAEIQDLRDQVLRAFAEMDNIRKRADRERLDTQKYAVSKFARDMLSVADNLERALAAVPSDTSDPVLKGLLDGVQVTERGLVSALERHGIKRIASEGAPFDPHQHQAVMEHHDPSVPNGTVVRVFEAGYMIEDRVLRPASVVVAKGGPKSEKQAPRPATEDGPEATNGTGGEGSPESA